MKKLFLGSIVLLAFNVTVILTQMSCKKEASAQANTSTSSPGLILFYKTSAQELWVANIDGSNQKKVPIAMPSGLKSGEGRLSADGKTVIFEGFQASNGVNAGIFSCSTDGTNLKKVVNENGEELLLNDAK